MAQHDYVIANGTGAAVRSDLNGGLAAIVSNNSGATEPATMYAYQWWADTTAGLLKIRNSANNAWVTVGTLASANLGLVTLASPTFTGTVTGPTFTASTAVNIPLGSQGSPTLFFTGDTNTGVFSPGADQVAITTGGTSRLSISSAGEVTTTNENINLIKISRGAGAISSNTAIGSGALQANTTASYNTANGYQALYSNTTGGANTANGYRALGSNTTGSSNTANGVDALGSNTTGSNNTANGYNALWSNTTGASNTANGYLAGYGTGSNSNTTGSNNTFIGNESVGASATASNVITLGNGSIATLRCQVTTITSLSDARDKTNITNLPAGLNFINALRPVAFDWNTRDGKKVGIPEFGFIAQELQEAQAATGITVPNLVSTENPDKLEASAGTLLPVLVNAVQELTAMVRDLQAELFILKGA